MAGTDRTLQLSIPLHRTPSRRTTSKNSTSGLWTSHTSADKNGMQERRTDHRLLCADLVEVCWDHAGREQHRVANLEDISLAGVCLQLEVHIAPGTKIVVRYGDGELVGLVRYCTHRHEGFFLGIELDQKSRWSTQHYTPRHLLDPRDLLQNTLMRLDVFPGSTARPN